MGDPAHKQPPSTTEDRDLSPPLDPPLTDAERAALLEGLAAANVSEHFRESIRRDLDAS